MGLKLHFAIILIACALWYQVQETALHGGQTEHRNFCASSSRICLFKMQYKIKIWQ